MCTLLKNKLYCIIEKHPRGPVFNSTWNNEQLFHIHLISENLWARFGWNSPKLKKKKVLINNPSDIYEGNRCLNQLEQKCFQNYLSILPSSKRKQSLLDKLINVEQSLISNVYCVFAVHASSSICPAPSLPIARGTAGPSEFIAYLRKLPGLNIPQLESSRLTVSSSAMPIFSPNL